jgi:adenylyltransferase/sulfurtransferase
LFPEPPSSKDVPNCSFNGVLGTLGMMGTMMAHETLKLIIGLPTLKNELVLFKTLNWSFTKLTFEVLYEILHENTMDNREHFV